MRNNRTQYWGDLYGVRRETREHVWIPFRLSPRDQHKFLPHLLFYLRYQIGDAYELQADNRQAGLLGLFGWRDVSYILKAEGTPAQMDSLIAFVRQNLNAYAEATEPTFTISSVRTSERLPEVRMRTVQDAPSARTDGATGELSV